MNNITASAPALEIRSDIELNQIYYTQAINTRRENNNNNNIITCNKKLVLNILIGLFFVSSFAYIIYVNNVYIYEGVKQIKNITQYFSY